MVLRRASPFDKWVKKYFDGSEVRALAHLTGILARSLERNWDRMPRGQQMELLQLFTGWVGTNCANDPLDPGYGACSRFLYEIGYA